MANTQLLDFYKMLKILKLTPMGFTLLYPTYNILVDIAVVQVSFAQQSIQPTTKVPESVPTSPHLLEYHPAPVCVVHPNRVPPASELCQPQQCV